MKAKLGIAPIAWWNDDLKELSDDVSLEECLSQASRAGFTGMETGRRFPMDTTVLIPILNRYNISVCGGWFSGLLLDGDIEKEKERISAQLNFFKAAEAPCIVYGETSRSVQGKKSIPLNKKPKLSDGEIKSYARKMTTFAEWCSEQGMPLSYHHHMAAVIETEEELNEFMSQSGEALPLLYDTGHMALSGGDVLRVIDNHHKRISHVHTKDVRQSIMNGLDRTKESFLDAVIKGVFTVPGDGDLNFNSIIKKLASKGYEGWFVVEAEQDPIANPPLKMAQTGHNELMEIMANSGYQVEK